MLCEECNQQPATVHLTTIIGGETRERNLCGECMQKYKAILMPANIQSLLTGLLHKPDKPQLEPSLRCSECGLDFEQFRKTGMLGCAQCYQVFRAQLKPVLQRIHGRVQHAGRIPRNCTDAQRAKRELEALRVQMEQAVSREDFEQAAALRDKIRAMQTAEGGVQHG